MKCSVLFLLSFLPLCSVAQNLVSNGNFEEYTDCPYGTSQYTFPATGWHVGWLTPDYFNTCADYESDVSIPNNWFGYQQPYNGNAYSGVFAFLVGGGREYIQGTLLSPLTIGTKYYVSLKVSLADYSATASNNMGVLFTTYQARANYCNNVAHIHTNTIISDSVNWVTINGCFEADSLYSYITIGNFFDDSHTDFADFPVNPDPSTFTVRYYVDDIRVSTDSIYAGGGCASSISNVDYGDIADASVSIFPNPVNEFITMEAHSILKSVFMYDVLGQLIMDKQNVQSNRLTMDIQKVKKGIYFLHIKTQNSIQIKKVIVN